MHVDLDLKKSFYRVFREETGVTPNVFRQRGQVDHYDEALKGYLDYEQQN